MHTRCHCGEPVAADSHPARTEHMSRSLAENFCLDCCMVRCDAYPAACMTSAELTPSRVF